MDDRFPRDPALDDAVADYLVAYQQQAELGETTHDALMTDTAAPEALRERIDRAARCIDLLLAFKPAGDEQPSGDYPKQNGHDGPARQGPNGSSGDPSDSAAAAAAGGNPQDMAKPRRLGRFEIRSQLGSGGFGIVYRAWDPRTAREVALKIPRIESLDSPELQSRFEQEAEASARLDHPHIVPVLEAGVDGMLPYIASIYYPGVTLARWLLERAAPIAPRDAALLVAQLAEAADHAHGKGVLHRDIKPSNVLLSHTAHEQDTAADVAKFELQESIAKLMDFGLAKLADRARDMTRSGAMLGTVRYMSPEQAGGRTREIGAASDVYSLGAVLYELLTGQPPFAGDSDVDVLRRVMMDDPTRIRVRRPDAPRDLETICAKCLEKERAQRYGSAGELAADLRRFLAGEPIHARRANPAEVAWKWSRRHPPAAALVAVCTASLVAGAIGIAIYNESLRDAARQANLHAAQAETLTREAQAQADRAEQQVYAGDLRAVPQALQANRIPDAQALLDRHVPVAGGTDRREFVYGYLSRSLKSDYTELPTHPAAVYSVAYTPNGSWIATACADGVVRVFSVADRERHRALTAHSGEVNEVTFSPSGKYMATGGADGTIRVWNTDNWDVVQAFGDRQTQVSAVLFTPDGQRLISAAGALVEIWDLATSRRVDRWESPNGAVSEVAASSDGKLLSVSTRLSTLVLDVNDLNSEMLLGDWDSGAHCSAFSKSGEYLLLGRRDGALHLLDVSIDRIVQFLPTVHTSEVKAVELSPDGNSMLTAARDGSVQVFDTTSWERKVVFHGHGDRVWDLAFSPTQNQVASCDSSGRVLLWRFPTADSIAERADHREFDWNAAMGSVSFSPRRTEIACGMLDGNLLFLDYDTLKLNRQWKVSDVAIKGLMFSSDARVHLTAAENGELCEWDVDSGERIRTKNCGTGFYHARWSPDGAKFAVTPKSKYEVWLWNWPEFGAPLKCPTTTSSTVELQYSPASDFLIACREKGSLIHKLNPLELGAPFGEQENFLRGGAFTPDGKIVFVAEWSKQIAAREVPSGRLLYRLSAHHAPVVAVGISSDGRTLASGSNDGVVILWDVASRRPALEFGDCPVSDWSELVFSPDGAWLMLRGGKSQRNFLWRSDPPQPVMPKPVSPQL